MYGHQRLQHLMRGVPMLWSPFSSAREARAKERGDHNMGAIRGDWSAVAVHSTVPVCAWSVTKHLL